MNSQVFTCENQILRKKTFGFKKNEVNPIKTSQVIAFLKFQNIDGST